MKHKPFGPAGVPVPTMGQGTWQMESDDRKTAVAALRAGLDLGMTHVDTAELYGSGSVEELVAEAIEGRRHEIFLVSKVVPSNASMKGALRACEQSLKRLKTDYLDCYLLHWPGAHPLKETIAAFEALCDAGKIRAWGVSNFDESELERAYAIAGPGRISCNQVLYNLRQRGVEHAVIPWCEAHDVSIVGYTPFGNAAFPPQGAQGAELRDLAAKHGATPRQIALAFLTRRPSVFAIPKASDPNHVRENAGTDQVALDAADIATLERTFPLGPRRAGVETL